MAKYYKVEELAGTEHEAVLRKLHVLEASVGMAQPGMCLGQNCDRLGRRRRIDVIKKKKKRTRKDNRDFVAIAFDHVKHSTVHRQGKEEEVKWNVAKKPPTEIGPLEPDDTAAKRQLRGYAVDKWKILDEKLTQNFGWRRAKKYILVVEKSCGNHRKENWRYLCSIPSILAEMITDFLVADVMFFGLIITVIVVICCGMIVWNLFKPQWTNHPCGVIDGRLQISFSGTVTDVTSRFAKTNSQRNGVNARHHPGHVLFCERHTDA